jgi:ABC-type multidrug transport system fused ATPase/permease subunit
VFTQLTFVLQRLRIALVRVAGVLDHPVEIVDSPHAVDFPKPLKKGIELKNVSYAYPVFSGDKDGNGAEDDNLPKPPAEPVIKDINLFIPAGTWLCIMGSSGAGKTTLLHLLSRLYEPTYGKILVDGIDLKDIKMLSLRHALGIVPQEAQIFSGSMRDNICYGLPDATNQQIMDAAKAAQLHDFILEMKVQYETLIGQRGTSLSGGQRQRLSLARALLTNPELLILDDCTSALDAATEQKIQETLAKILIGKTAIMVSQRVSMAMRCHKIAVLENGVISEYGTHQELLERKGFYAKLFSQQTE